MSLETTSLPAECAFPLFKRKFFAESSWRESSAPLITPSAGALQLRKSLGKLDLRSLPRDDGPPTELQARREKFQFFEQKCSQVAEGLYLGGEVVARNRELLQSHGITHVVNAVGFLVPNTFESEGVKYLTLRLLDTPAEDLLSVLYDVIEFIDSAIEGGGRVYVHCSQGVSRSAALAIAYLMWKQGRTYDDVFQSVRGARGVVNPNIGFICQLLQWQRRRAGSNGLLKSPTPTKSRPGAAADMPVSESSYVLSAARESSFSGPAGLKIYRLAPHSANDTQYIVPKWVAQLPPVCLDRRFSFVLQSHSGLLIWHGAESPASFRAAAARCVAHLQRFEGAPEVASELEQGAEPSGLWAGLAASGLFRTSLDGSLLGDESSSGSGVAESAIGTNTTYDSDWDVWLGKVRANVPPTPLSTRSVAAAGQRGGRWDAGGGAGMASVCEIDETEASGLYSPRYREAPGGLGRSLADDSPSPSPESGRVFKKCRSEAVRGGASIFTE